MALDCVKAQFCFKCFRIIEVLLRKKKSTGSVIKGIFSQREGPPDSSVPSGLGTCNPDLGARHTGQGLEQAGLFVVCLVCFVFTVFT